MRVLVLLLLQILLISVASACVTVIQPRHARLGQVIGIVDEPRSVSLRIMTTNKDVREVQTDLKTRYTTRPGAARRAVRQEHHDRSQQVEDPADAKHEGEQHPDRCHQRAGPRNAH